MILFRYYVKIFIVTLIISFRPIPLLASSGMPSIITDIEVDSLIQDISIDIFGVAGLNTKYLDMFVISDPSINAFVYQNSVFVNTGLISFVKNSDALYGVLAHETGHMAKKHIMRMVLNAEDAINKIGGIALLLSILSIGLAPLSAGMILSALPVFLPTVGLGMFLQNNLQYSRSKESEADQAAITYLKKLKKPLSGLRDIFSFFDSGTPDSAIAYKYFYTHPLPAERLDAISIAQHEFNSIHLNPVDCKIEKRLRRARAKILGYLDSGNYNILHRVDEPHFCFSKQEIQFFKNYKKLYSLIKNKSYDRALSLCNGMIAENPKDPYLLETKSSIFLETGKVQEAIKTYRVFKGMMSNRLVSYQFALVLSRSDRKEQLYEAIDQLKYLIAMDIPRSKYYYMLGFIYGKLQKSCHKNLYFAESLIRSNQPKLAAQKASKAISAFRRQCKSGKMSKDERLKQQSLCYIAYDILDVSLSKMKSRKDKKLYSKYKEDPCI
ncbi:M48 family metalloprotease [Rickettsiales bacterium]|nr:M48 family metalloprotease [Rickettsiales bacterium]